MKKVIITFMVTGLISIATWSKAQVTNLYHFEREFVPVTNSTAPVTVYKIIMGADQLTGIVGPTNILIISNQTFATEYEGFAWGYDSHWAAWTSALSVHSQYFQIHSNVFYDNVGYIKGTREAYAAYGAFVWYLKNTIAFTSSVSSVYVDSSGVTSPIASVLVGTIGDFCPQTMVTDIGPMLNTNYLGDGVSTDYVARADVNAYYKLVPFTDLGVNNDDSDGDGIPDFADGYNLDSGNGLDNVSSNDFFTPWKLILSGYANPTQAQIRITYSDSDPMGVSVTTNGYTPASGNLRLWRKQAFQARSGVSFLSSGDYIPPGTFAVTSLGFSVSTHIVEVYLESVNPGTNQFLLVEVDPDGDGPKDFVCIDRLESTIISIEYLNSSNKPVSALSIGKWENAFTAGNPVSVKNDFIDLDSDRFSLRVNDPSQIGSGIVKVILSTDSPGTIYDDPPTEIELKENPPNSGVFISTNLLLVSDTIDDVFTNLHVTADNMLNDRTHIVAVGGTLIVQYPTISPPIAQIAIVPPELKTIDVEIIILRDKLAISNGVPVISISDVNDFWTIARERYAHVGINLQWTTPVIRDPPQGVDLGNGLTVLATLASTNVATETKSLINSLGTTNSTSDIHVFYVNTISAGPMLIGGIALAPFYFDDADDPYTFNAIISNDPSTPWGGYAAAHELTHLTTDAGHPTTNTWRLMHNDVLTTTDETGSRRLIESEVQTIRGCSHAH